MHLKLVYRRMNIKFQDPYSSSNVYRDTLRWKSELRVMSLYRIYLERFLLIFFCLSILLFMLLQLSQFFLLCPHSTQPTPYFHSQSPHHRPPMVIHICFLTVLSPSFSQFPHLIAVSLFHVSLPLVQFWSLVNFAHRFQLQVRLYSICLLPTGLFHLA